MLTDHIGLKVKDLNTSVDFYSKNLDFVVDSNFETEKSHIVFLKNENTVIELICPKSGIYDCSANSVINHMAFIVPDIYEYIEKLKKNNIKFKTGEVKEATGKKIIFFYGPDGEELELVQYLK